MLKNKNIKELIIAGTFLIMIYLGLRNIITVLDILKKLISFLTPFIAGGVIAFIINIPVKKIENSLFRNVKKPKLKKLKRPLSFLITLFSIILVIAFVIFIIVPQLKEAIIKIAIQIPEAYENLIIFIKNSGLNYPFISEFIAGLEIDRNDITLKILNAVSGSTFGVLQSGIGAVGKIFSAFLTFFLGIIVSMYLIFQKEKLIIQSKKILLALFSEKNAIKLLDFLRLTQTTFTNFLTGQCVEAVILGTLFSITMLILRLPYAFLIGILVAVCSLVPLAGAAVALVVGVILMAMTDLWNVLIFFIMFFVLQQLEEHLIYPHVVGKSIGLPGILVLFAVIVGGKMAGIAGIFIGIPTCALVYSLFGSYVNKKIIKKGVGHYILSSDTEEATCESNDSHENL